MQMGRGMRFLESSATPEEDLTDIELNGMIKRHQ